MFFIGDKMKLGKRKFIFFKIFFIIFLMILVFNTTISYLYKNINISNDNYLKLLFNDTYGNKFYTTLVEIISNKLNPLELIDIEVKNKEFNLANKINNPIIYIYSTNMYNSYKTKYNNNPNIYLVLYYLSNKLNSIGIPTMFENNNINSFANNNDMNIDDSIKLLTKNYNIKYIIEIERGNINRNIKSNNKIYAGISLYTNENNINLVTKLNDNLNNKINNISKIYFNNEYNNMKIDIGYYNNDFNDVLRSIDILFNSIKEVLYE